MNKKPSWIVILSIVFIGLVAVLGLVNLFSESYDYDDPEMVHVENWLTYSSQVPQEGYMVLYFYSESCSFCQDIQNDILGFAASNPNDIPVLLADVNDPDLRGSQQFAPVQISRTPTVTVYLDGEIVDQFVGTDPILQMIDDFNAGTFTP